MHIHTEERHSNSCPHFHLVQLARLVILSLPPSSLIIINKQYTCFTPLGCQLFSTAQRPSDGEAKATACLKEYLLIIISSQC